MDDPQMFGMPWPIFLLAALAGGFFWSIGAWAWGLITSGFQRRGP